MCPLTKIGNNNLSTSERSRLRPYSLLFGLFLATFVVIAHAWAVQSDYVFIFGTNNGL